jgi:hypothetical protein
MVLGEGFIKLSAISSVAVKALAQINVQRFWGRIAKISEKYLLIY